MSRRLPETHMGFLLQYCREVGGAKSAADTRPRRSGTRSGDPGWHLSRRVFDHALVSIIIHDRKSKQQQLVSCDDIAVCGKDAKLTYTHRQSRTHTLLDSHEVQQFPTGTPSFLLSV